MLSLSPPAGTLLLTTPEKPSLSRPAPPRPELFFPARSYDLQNARNAYRDMVGPEGMNARLVRRYLEASTLLLAPICP